MNINITLIGQMIAFGIFVWFCMNQVWPPIMQALEERKKKIADGLAAAQAGEQAQEEAQAQAEQFVTEAKAQASEIINTAQKRANQMVEDAKGKAKDEADRIVEGAHAEMAQELEKAKDELRKQVAALAVEGASAVLGREVDEKAHADVLGSLAAKL